MNVIKYWVHFGFFDIAGWRNLRSLNLSSLIIQIRSFAANLIGIDLMNWRKGYTDQLCRKISRSFNSSHGSISHFLYCFYAFSVYVVLIWHMKYEARSKVIVRIFSFWVEAPNCTAHAADNNIFPRQLHVKEKLPSWFFKTANRLRKRFNMWKKLIKVTPFGFGHDDEK